MSETVSATKPLPAELAWLNGMTIKFAVDPDTDENGITQHYGLSIEAGAPHFSQHLNGRVIIPTTEMTFAVSPQELVGQHIVSMTFRVFETLRHAYLTGLQQSEAASKQIITP
jgi:hypothetical protein